MLDKVAMGLGLMIGAATAATTTGTLAAEAAKPPPQPAVVVGEHIGIAAVLEIARIIHDVSDRSLSR